MKSLEPLELSSTNDYFPNNNPETLNLSYGNEEDSINCNNDLTQINNIFNENNYSNIYEIPNYKPIEKNKQKSQNPSNKLEKNIKLLGRKTKNSGETGEHTKYSEDNMTKKTKVLLKNDLLEFINDKIKTELNLSEIKINGKIYKNDQIKLLNIKQTKISDITVDGIKTFLNTKVKDFFNDEVSKNYSSYPPNFNALLIEKLYEMENAESVTSIMDKTMLECLKYYRKDEDMIDNYEYACLNGLEKKFEGLKNRLMKNPEKKNDEKYVDELINLIMEFEDVYYKKRPRMKRSKNH